MNHSDDLDKLENKYEALKRQLGREEMENDKHDKVEQGLKIKVEQLQKDLQERTYTEQLSKEHLEQLKRKCQDFDQENKLLADRLENSKAVTNDTKSELNEVESQMHGMKRRLIEAEQGRQEAEQRLADAGTNTGADNYLKEELNKSRKENISLVEKIKEMERKVKVLKNEKVERTESVKKYNRRMADQCSERVVRTQIPLLSGRAGEREECGEHIVRIRILEQEVERHLRRVAVLEQQLREVEQMHKERSEQLLVERREEREKENTRHANSLKQLEHSLNSRERMYKERISGLEEQIHILKDQMSKEAISRRSYISSSQALSSDVSELRRQLDQSLDVVQNASHAGIEGGLLDREASRLEHTIARQGRDIVGRLTPSKRGNSPYRVDRLADNSTDRVRISSAENLNIITSTPIGVGARERQEEPRMRGTLAPLVRRNSDFTYRSRDHITRRGLTPDFDRMGKE